MTEITNVELQKELIRAVGLQPGAGALPSMITDKVVPVVETNPMLLRQITVVKRAQNTTINSSVTVVTLPTDKDFYLVAMTANFINDAASTATTGEIILTPYDEGITVNILEMNNITGLPLAQNQTLALPRPLRLKRGSGITATINGVAVGAAKLSVCIFGYYDAQRL